MQTYSELRANVKVADSSFAHLLARPDTLTVLDDTLVVGDERLALTQESRDRIFASVSAPATYLRELSPSFQGQALAHHVSRGDFGATVAVAARNGEVFAITRGDLVHLSGEEVLTALAEGLGEGSTALSVARIADTGDRLDVELVSSRKAIEVRRGDLVQGGLHLTHHRFGERATLIQTYMLRLVCTNGMTMRECVSRDGIVRTRKLAAGHPNGKALQLDQIRRLATRNWEALEPRLDEVKATSERPVDVEAVLSRWLQRARISPQLMGRLLGAWREEGSEPTQFAAVNALTRVATHDASLSLRQRRILASLGGLLAFSEVHICPRCFTVLAGNGGFDGNGAVTNAAAA